MKSESGFSLAIASQPLKREMLISRFYFVFSANVVVSGMKNLKSRFWNLCNSLPTICQLCASLPQVFCNHLALTTLASFG